MTYLIRVVVKIIVIDVQRQEDSVGGCCNYLGLIELGYRFGNAIKYRQGICLGKFTTGCIHEVQAL